MTRTRWLIVAFWVFVLTMIGLELRQKQVHIDQVAAEDPRNGHYFYTPPIATKASPPPPVATLGPAIHQTAFVVHPNKPGFGTFTCDVTVKNEGLQKAKAIEVHVRPFLGVMYGNASLGHVKYRPVPESDPLSQYGEWLAFPDLKPGEVATESAVFLNHPNVTPGYNPNPEINFEPVK